MTDINRVVAEYVAEKLVRTHGEDVENLSVYETVQSELDHYLDPDEVEKLVFGFLKVAELHVSIPTFRVGDDGKVKTSEELHADLQAKGYEF